MSKFTSSYDVDNRYRFYKSLNPETDISVDRRGVRPGVDNATSKSFLKRFANNLNENGIYIIEDVHRKPSNIIKFYNFFKK